MIVGIAGGSGSGKTTLAQKLVSLLDGITTVQIQQDTYYKDQSKLPGLAREWVNYDCPDAIDVDLLVYHLYELKYGGSIRQPVYDFVSHTRRKGYKIISSAEIIIVEGTLIFSDRRIRELIDLKVFLDVPAEVRLARRILRDTNERGRSKESVVKQWFDSVIPMHEMRAAPTKRYADTLFTQDPSGDDMELLAATIRGRL